MKALLTVFALLACVSFVAADNWAVLVAGSEGWWNYRHQADICHAYQVLHSHGISDDHIIVFMYDDIAQNTENPFPGKIFNHPSSGPGKDVYAGVPKDYTGKDVTPQNFLKVLEGDEAAMASIGSHKVLKSGPEDRVFIFFSDHGSSGLIAFPDGAGYLYANELMATLKKMNEKKMYKELVFYLEACFSGSMFENLLDPSLHIYATTAANAHESSYGCYCGGEAMVDGKDIGSCLGDLYSINWMEDSDVKNLDVLTLKEQYETVKQKTEGSEVCQFGDLSISSKIVGAFQGTSKANVFRLNEKPPKPTILVDSRDAKLEYLYGTYRRTKTEGALLSLMDELKSRKYADGSFGHVASILFPTKGLSVLDEPVGKFDQWDCYKTAVDMAERACGRFSDYSLKYIPLLASACQTGASVTSIVNAISRSCQSTLVM